MPLEFQCPHCGISTNVDDRFSGQSGPCSACGKTVTIPPFGRGAGAAPPAATGGGAIAALVLVVVVAGMLFCGGAGLVMFRGLSAAAPRPSVAVTASSQCKNNLKVLGVAMHNYHDTYRTFPPAYVADEEGTPMHSWRVLLLPFIGRRDLYEQYDFDEPWDSPNNSLLFSMTPSEFRCLEDALSGYEQTSYAMIVGPGMLCDDESASRVADIKDGTSNTIMFVESHGSGIVWTEPRDLDAATMSFLINTGQMGELNGHGDHVKAVFCDGTVHEFPDAIPPEIIREMATIGGGEVVAVP